MAVRQPPIRMIPHEAVPDCGSFEVRFSDGRNSVYFYWDDIPGRRLRREAMTRDQALEAAKALARAERDKTEHACPLCDDSGWVCEAHPDQPWDGPHACTCGAAGAPCPHCNRTDDGEPPRPPNGFEPDAG